MKDTKESAIKAINEGSASGVRAMITTWDNMRERYHFIAAISRSASQDWTLDLPHLTDNNVREVEVRFGIIQLFFEQTVYFRPNQHLESVMNAKLKEIALLANHDELIEINRTLTSWIKRWREERKLFTRKEARSMKGKWFAIRGLAPGIFQRIMKHEMCNIEPS